MNKVLYLIGSLRNPRVPELAKRLRKECSEVEVFNDWFAAGPEADDYWKEYELGRGRTLKQALLEGYAAEHVFQFDKFHLDRSTHALLVLPAGKSGHMEAMYAKYSVGAKTAVLLDEDADKIRFDVMLKFLCPSLLETEQEVISWLDNDG